LSTEGIDDEETISDAHGEEEASEWPRDDVSSPATPEE
jgi:hypothetical protein